MCAGSTVNAITLRPAGFGSVLCWFFFYQSGDGYFSLPLKTWSQARFLTLRWVDGSVFWKHTENFNISNEGIARIQAFPCEKYLVSLVFALLRALKPACTERFAFQIQSYLDT